MNNTNGHAPIIGSSRRQFLLSSAAAGAAVLVPSAAFAAADPMASGVERSSVCLFSKCLGSRSVEQLAEAIAALGFKSVDLTVRPAGHVLPDRVADDLPRAHETLQRAEIGIAMITTDVTSVRQKHALPVVRTAAALGIRYMKLGYYPCWNAKAVQQAFADAKAELRELAPVLAEHRIRAGFHNHSGMYIGALMWDEWDLLRDLDPRCIGSYFDGCHATIEGGSGGWRIGLNVLAPRINMLAVKDFAWQKEEGEWRPRLGPLGEGAVRWGEVLATLKSHRFAGPISLHIEYGRVGAPGSDDEKAILAAVRKDAAFLRAALVKAGIDAV